jgi:uncharacterized membrane protein YczE
MVGVALAIDAGIGSSPAASLSVASAPAAVTVVGISVTLGGCAAGGAAIVGRATLIGTEDRIRSSRGGVIPR